MKIAIPTENGRLHGHFGGCRQFALVETDADQKQALRTDVVPAPEHQPGLFPRWLRAQGVQVVIAGGIGRRALANFAHHGIVVRAGVTGAPVAALVDAYLKGELTGTPEGCDQHGHHHHHEHEHAPHFSRNENRHPNG
jgi:predicted Fe-Mo cluster-binding NifX family protein